LRKPVAAFAFLFALTAAPLLSAQSLDAAPSFEVASIKPSDPGHAGAQMFSPGPGRFTAITATLKDLMLLAYNVRPSQIEGGPQWSATEAYDIAAKAAGTPSSDQIHLMLRALLADRFQLKVRRETREVGVYDLVLDRRGPKLYEVNAAGRGVGMQRGNLHAFGADMATLANVLSGHLDRVVIDHTGLKGFYDFALQWTADDSDPTGASVFPAIQEQLGLKLEAAKEPVEVLIIERAERASQN
jgi:uncharacterized protein (TIGR03435 family)